MKHERPARLHHSTHQALSVCLPRSEQQPCTCELEGSSPERRNRRRAVVEAMVRLALLQAAAMSTLIVPSTHCSTILSNDGLRIVTSNSYWNDEQHALCGPTLIDGSSVHCTCTVAGQSAHDPTTKLCVIAAVASEPPLGETRLFHSLLLHPFIV